MTNPDDRMGKLRNTVARMLLDNPNPSVSYGTEWITDLIRQEVLGAIREIETISEIDSSMPGLGNLVKNKISDLKRRWEGAE